MLRKNLVYKVAGRNFWCFLEGFERFKAKLVSRDLFDSIFQTFWRDFRWKISSSPMGYICQSKWFDNDRRTVLRHGFIKTIKIQGAILFVCLHLVIRLWAFKDKSDTQILVLFRPSGTLSQFLHPYLITLSFQKIVHQNFCNLLWTNNFSMSSICC